MSWSFIGFIPPFPLDGGSVKLTERGVWWTRLYRERLRLQLILEKVSTNFLSMAWHFFKRRGDRRVTHAYQMVWPSGQGLDTQITFFLHVIYCKQSAAMNETLSSIYDLRGYCTFKFELAKNGPPPTRDIGAARRTAIHTSES